MLRKQEHSPRTIRESSPEEATKTKTKIELKEWNNATMEQTTTETTVAVYIQKNRSTLKFIYAFVDTSFDIRKTKNVTPIKSEKRRRPNSRNYN